MRKELRRNCQALISNYIIKLKKQVWYWHRQHISGTEHRAQDNPCSMYGRFTTKKTGTYGGERAVSSMLNSTGKTGQPHAEE